MNKYKSTIIEYLKVIIVTVIITYSILYFIQISRVVGASMEPTYSNGNIVLVNKKFYSYDNCKYNDIIVASVTINGEEEQIIKRVIGKGGDTISCVDKQLYRNGKKLNETYINEEMQDSNWEVTVDKESVFVMGDNRNHSGDSRSIGSLNFKNHIVGKVFFKVI